MFRRYLLRNVGIFLLDKCPGFATKIQAVGTIERLQDGDHRPTRLPHAIFKTYRDDFALEYGSVCCPLVNDFDLRAFVHKVLEFNIGKLCHVAFYAVHVKANDGTVGQMAVIFDLHFHDLAHQFFTNGLVIYLDQQVR